MQQLPTLRLCFILVSFTLFSGALNSQRLLPATIQDERINYSQLRYADSLLLSYTKNNWLTGAVVLVAKNGRIIYQKAAGYADVAAKKAMTPETIFRIASQTKAIVSLAVMQLLEKGKLTLDQPVSDFIPEFKNPTVVKTFNPTDSSYTTAPATRELTFRDLLTHTSGIDYPLIGNDTMRAIYAKHRIPSGLGFINENLLDRMKALGKLPLIHQPGARFTYGLNTDLLGCLVELISGQSLEYYCRKNIFEPLGMNDTYFNVPDSKASRVASVYAEDDNHVIKPWTTSPTGIDAGYPLMNKKYFSGGAGLSSTAYDYAVFLQMLLNKGSYNGHQLLGRKTVELMLSPQLPDHLFGDDNFSLGFGITSKKSSLLKMISEGSFAWGGYFGTTYWADPKESMVFVIMTQHGSNSHYDYIEKLTNIIYSSVK